MEHQAFENISPIFPSFVAQNLAQGFTTLPSRKNKTSTPSLVTGLSKDFGLTLPFVGTLDTNPLPPTTTWTPTFGAPLILEDPKKPYKLLELHYSTTNSTY